ncbi:MAG: WYL domain-containing protein [Bacilli bacterium]|nr:WYL domain-containing protein [Bacilli bacterium]
MELYEKNGNAIYILNVLKKYSDEYHYLQVSDIKEKVLEEYEVDIDPRTIRRIINLLKEKLEYDISTRAENKKGYYLIKDPDTDFERGEIRAIIDTFSYATYITPKISKSIINKCINMQNIYEQERFKDYHVYSSSNKTSNMEVIKNLEDISEAIYKKKKITFQYQKYDLRKNKLEIKVVDDPVVSPYAIAYNDQEFYLICLKNKMDKLYSYRIDRMKDVTLLKNEASDTFSKKDVEQFMKSSVSMFAGETTKITVRCKMFLLDNMVDVFGSDLEFKRVDDEHFECTLEINKDGMKYWVLRNIENVEVISPVSFQKEIKKILKERS